MDAFRTSVEILDYAIEREEESFAFYTGIANSAENRHIRELFHSFAREELRHKETLIEIKRGDGPVFTGEEIGNLKIAEYLPESEPGPTMNYPEALRLAMGREKTAFHLYADLAGRAGTDSLRNTFLMLAREEAKHKLFLELEYDQAILREN